MKIKNNWFCLMGVCFLLITSHSWAQTKEISEKKAESTSSKPNILIIVGDDIGYSDYGFMGSEIHTPNIDKLAKEGAVFTNFHVSPTCSVTRSMLLTGVDSHLIGLGAFDFTIYPPLKDHPGYESYLTKNALTIATILKDNGYHTYASGKWHLGAKQGYLPKDRGFSRSFMLVGGGANHFNNKGMLPSEPVVEFTADGKIVDRGSDEYSDTLYNRKLIEMLEESKKDGKPFFAYLAYQSAHFPLQVPDDTWKKYVKHYKKGWTTIQKERFTNMINAGIIPKAAKLPNHEQLAGLWKKLNAEDKDFMVKRFALYAAMVEIQDRHIGEIIDYLKKNKLYDNTIIFYLSDNGPESTVVEGQNANPEIQKWVSENYDNTYTNLGTKTSNTTVGPSWARASATPLNFYKGYTAEGGIRVPLIVKDIKSTYRGSKTNTLSDLKDIPATVLEMAEVKHPGNFYQGRSVLPISGISMKPYLDGEREHIHPDDQPIGRELFGNPALFMGDHKLLKLRSGMKGGDGEFHLYNIKNDPGETQDLKDKMPELYEKMFSAYKNFMLTNNVQPIAEDWASGKVLK